MAIIPLSNKPRKVRYRKTKFSREEVVNAIKYRSITLIDLICEELRVPRQDLVNTQEVQRVIDHLIRTKDVIAVDMMGEQTDYNEVGYRLASKHLS